MLDGLKYSTLHRNTFIKIDQDNNQSTEAVSTLPKLQNKSWAQDLETVQHFEPKPDSDEPPPLPPPRVYQKPPPNPYPDLLKYSPNRFFADRDHTTLLIGISKPHNSQPVGNANPGVGSYNLVPERKKDTRKFLKKAIKAEKKLALSPKMDYNVPPIVSAKSVTLYKHSRFQKDQVDLFSGPGYYRPKWRILK